jgi:hypothetical protein
MKRYFSLIFIATALLTSWITPASAVVIDVFAQANATGGTGAASGLTLSRGQSFTVSASPTDIWSAGSLPRWSNANGLIGPLLATGTDESGATAGTVIGASFGNLTQLGLSAPFGALVGEIGGTYFLVGTNYTGTAAAAGPLNLFFWDAGSGDNSDKISVTITTATAAVPLPGSAYLLIVAGLPLLRRRWSQK